MPNRATAGFPGNSFSPVPMFVADVNGDGKPDIVWMDSASGRLYVSRMAGKGLVESVFIGVAPSGMTLGAVADFDGDGRAELLFRNIANDVSSPVMWFWDTTKNTLTLGAQTTLARSPNWAQYTIAGTGDTTGDGKADIVFRGDGATGDYVWCMNGASVLSEAAGSSGYLRTVPTEWHMMQINDFNADGRADIFWRDYITGENYFYPLNGSTIGAGEGYLRTVGDLTWVIIGSGSQFDATSNKDILWRNLTQPTNQRLYVYPILNGTTITANEGYFTNGSEFDAFTLIGIGDFSGTGAAKDCVWWNSTTRQLQIATITFNGGGDIQLKYTMGAGVVVPNPA